MNADNIKSSRNVQNVNAIHYEKNSICFYTVQGKNFCKELITTKKVQILGLIKYKVIKGEESNRWRDLIFEELENVYPGKTRDIGTMFMIKDTEIEYFNLGVYPISSKKLFTLRTL